MSVVNLGSLTSYTAALLLVLTCLVYTIIQRRTDKYQNVVYIVMLGIILINALSEGFLELVKPYVSYDHQSYVIADICNYLYFLFHTALAPTFFFYEICVTGLIKKLKDRHLIIYNMPFFVTELLVIINPFTRWVYYYDEHFAFHRNWAEVLIYVVAAIYISVSVLSLFKTWKAITFKKKLAFLYFFVLVVSGILIQMFYLELRTELFAEALAMLGIMLSIESEEDCINQDTGVYNRHALIMDLNNYRELDIPVDILFIKVNDLDTALKKTGSTNTDGFTEIMAAFLRTIIPRNCIYTTSPGQFVVIISDRENRHGRTFLAKIKKRLDAELTADEVAERIKERFEVEWLIGRAETHLEATIVEVGFPDELSDTSDILFIADRSMPRNLSGKVLKGENLSFALRRIDVEKAIIRGLRENEFEVYYQPTYYAEDHRLYGAEALLRLKDKIIGNVPPDEFIPIAEQIGVIDEISEFVLKTVCEFLATGIPEKYGVESINVNLSVIQCIRPDFAEKILGIVEEYKIDKKLVNFEITESVEPDDYESLRKVMSGMKDAGFHFSMDDYGTGYSNMQSSFSLDFDIVKIDKSILWAADKTDFGRIVLENSVDMIKRMDRKIVVEGVETKEHAEKLRNMGVEYLQGFYFSKPVPKSEFIEIISR